MNDPIQNKQRNEQALARSARASNIDRWALLSEEYSEHARERREIEERLGMTSQELYVAAVRQATERVNLPAGGAHSLRMENFGYRHRFGSEEEDGNK